MTFKQFRDKYDGKFIDFDNYFGNQCVDLYRQYVKEVLGFKQSPLVKGAKDIWTTYLKDKFQRISNTPDGLPKEGDIIIWRTEPYGHVGIFVEGTTGSFRSFDQNYPKGTPCHIQGHRYTNVLGWLHPISKDEVPDETLLLQERALKALQKAVDKKLYGNIESAARAVVDLVKDAAEYKSHIKSMEEQELRSTHKMLNLSNSIKELEKEATLLKADIGKKDLKITELEKIISTQQTDTPTANDLSDKQLLKLLIQRITMKKVKNFILAFLKDDRVETALWIGLSQAVASIAAYLLTVPELASYAGVINAVAYIVKSTNDKRKK